MKISNNFTLEEFEKSETALAYGIDNAMPANLRENIVALVNNLLQPLCDNTGWSCLISSGYRCDRLNRKVGGADMSQHTTAEAADCKFYIKENGRTVFISTIQVMKKVNELKLEFDQMIAYPSFVHLSFTMKRRNRHQVLYNSSYKGERL